MRSFPIHPLAAFTLEKFIIVLAGLRFQGFQNSGFVSGVDATIALDAASEGTGLVGQIESLQYLPHLFFNPTGADPITVGYHPGLQQMAILGQDNAMLGHGQGHDGGIVEIVAV